MGHCDYDSSSSSDSDSPSTGPYFWEEDLRYPHISTTQHQTKANKKRTWSETDDESDLPGVPNYQVRSSWSRFCYDTDSNSSNSGSDDDSRENKRRRTDNGRPVAPVAGSVRDMDSDLVKCPTPAPAPRPTTAVGLVLRPRVRGLPTSRFISGNLDDGLQYFTLRDPPSQDERKSEPVPVAARPTQAPTKPFVHTHPAPKPTTRINVPLRLRKAAARVAVRPTPVVPRTTWMGVTNSWPFPTS